MIANWREPWRHCRDFRQEIGVHCSVLGHYAASLETSVDCDVTGPKVRIVNATPAQWIYGAAS